MHDDVSGGNDKILVELAAFCALHAVSWPHHLHLAVGQLVLVEDHSSRVVRDEGAVVGGVEVSGVRNEIKGQPLAQIVDSRNDFGAACDSEAALWRAKVILHVDDQQSRARVLHMLKIGFERFESNNSLRGDQVASSRINNFWVDSATARCNIVSLERSELRIVPDAIAVAVKEGKDLSQGNR